MKPSWECLSFLFGFMSCQLSCPLLFLLYMGAVKGHMLVYFLLMHFWLLSLKVLGFTYLTSMDALACLSEEWWNRTVYCSVSGTCRELAGLEVAGPVSWEDDFVCTLLTCFVSGLCSFHIFNSMPTPKSGLCRRRVSFKQVYAFPWNCSSFYF